MLIVGLRECPASVSALAKRDHVAGGASCAYGANSSWKENTLMLYYEKHQRDL